MKAEPPSYEAGQVWDGGIPAAAGSMQRAGHVSPCLSFSNNDNWNNIKWPVLAWDHYISRLWAADMFDGLRRVCSTEKT